MNYEPCPIDVTGIALPDEMLPLLDPFSKNIHEVWAQTRIRQGWSYGCQRDDNLKQHPDIIPYEQLTEPEKEHDRNSVAATIKALIAMGYRITKP
jgi:ryanodine receptor 2